MSREKQIEWMADDICRIEIEGEHEGTTTCINYNQATTLACGLVAQGWRKQSGWISVEERLPDPEKEVLILAIKRYVYMGEVKEVPTITTAFYEDGTMSTEDSEWNWYDIDFIYDEENDVQYIPEGWWEYRHYNPDDVYNNAVDDKVTHWMDLPDPPKGGGA